MEVSVLHIVIMVTLSMIMMWVCVIWLKLIIIARISQKHLPVIGDCAVPPDMPKVSIIVPARNEEEDIGPCIRTLLRQDYENYEIILIDDGSDDVTYDIVEAFVKKYPDKIILKHTKKPDGWLGKTWACTEAVKHATGQILLFTDADTKHEPDSLRRAVSYMESEKLDCLTLTQKVGIPEMWVRATIPVITSFKLVHPDGRIYYSAKSINDPKNPMGGLNGAYFLIKKSVHEAVGGFESIKNEVVEDWAIGRLIKKSGYRIRIVNGGDMVSSMWARDLPTLNNIFKRLILPFVRNDKSKATFDCLLLLALLFVPYPMTVMSGAVYAYSHDVFSLAMLAFSSAATVLHMISYGVQAKSFGIPLKNVFLAPLGGFVASVGFLDGLRTKHTDWRGREITPDEMVAQQTVKKN